MLHSTRDGMGSETGRTAINHENYVRLSPLDSEARKRITEIYEDRSEACQLQRDFVPRRCFPDGFEDASPRR